MKRRTFLTGLTGLTGGTALLTAGLLARMPGAAADVPDLVQGHPRLLATDLSGMATLVGADARAARWYGKTKAAADALLDAAPVEYVIPDGTRLLATSREVVHRVYTLGVAGIVEDDPGYWDRLALELQTVCEFDDWNDHRHFLDTAEMTHAVAIGYDWFHEHWTEGQREVFRSGLRTHGLEPGLEIFEGRSTPHPWFKWTNNWNIVCNGGLILGSLAIADLEPELTDRVLDHALSTLPLALEPYAPDGGYPEGIGYWEYATKYLVLALAALESATSGSELSDSAGVESTVDFPMHMTGPTGLGFNYYDSAAGAPRPAEAFWLARTFGRPDHAWWAALGADTRQPGWSELPLGLLWYDPTSTAAPIEAGTDLDAQFHGGCQVAASRSGWERSDALFVAGKAGDNTTSHSDLDIGTFVLEALGQRWFTELGSDDYNLPGYFHAPRWTYYRKRAEGQNTLVVNPSEDPGQELAGTGTLLEGWGTEASAAFIIDGAGAQPDLAAWRRGWRLDDFRRYVIVQDEIVAAAPSDLWWFAHTAAAIDIAPDGRSATLSAAGKELRANLLSPSDATFTEMAARPLWTSPQPDGQATNAGLRKLAINLSGVTEVRIAVQLTPVLPGHTETAAEIEPLADWQPPQHAVALLSSLQIDGQEVPGFSPTNFTYGADVDRDSTITATAASGRAVVKRTEGGGATIRVIAAGARTTTYRIWPDIPIGPRNFPGVVLASSDDGNIPANTLDGDLTTRWSAEGDGEWIGFDMGDDGPVAEVQIAWFSGDTRQTAFDIEVAAADDADWTLVYSGVSSGTTSDLESQVFDSRTARYLRIVGHGNSASGWNSISEVVIPGRTVTYEPVLRIEELRWSVPAIPLDGYTETTLTAVLGDGTATELDGAEVSYAVGDPTIVAIDEQGGISGLAEGETWVAAIARLDGHRLLHSRVSVQVADPDRPVYEPVADTYVRDGAHADTVFGTHSGMIVKGIARPDSGFMRRTFITFEVPAQTRPVNRVILELHGMVADNNGTEQDQVVCLADGVVDEASTTWGNQPAIGAALGSVHMTSTQQWWEIELVDAVHESILDGGALTLAVVQEGEGLATQLSARHTQTPPRLRVELG
jgi:hypothetical protein